MGRASLASFADLVDVWPRLLSCRQLDDVAQALLPELGLDPAHHRAAGLVTCDQDDALYVALDEATKHADVSVGLAKSFYAGSRHASGPLSGEVIGVLGGATPDDVAEGLWALREHLRPRPAAEAHAGGVCFQSFGPGTGTLDERPAFLAHVVEACGTYLSAQAGVAVGEPLGYLIAPPLEATVGVDAALKAADVRLLKFLPPPSETNFAGAYLAGALPELQAARDAFVAAVRDVVVEPLRAARRPSRLRR